LQDISGALLKNFRLDYNFVVDIYCYYVTLTPVSAELYNSGVASAKERGVQMIVRLAPEEKESFERAAEISGQNLSDWVRTRLRQLAANELSSAGEMPVFMKVKANKRS
jgi:predicted HTH domain antitoxin